MKNLEPKIDKPKTLIDVTLREILTYENPHVLEYDAIIKEAERRLSEHDPRSFQAPWGFSWADLKRVEHEREVSFLYDKLNNSVLIDLAAGLVHKPNKTFPAGIYEFAKRTGVGLYIGVERHLDASFSSDPHTDVSSTLGMFSKDDMKHILVQNDALDFVSRMESNSIIDGKPVNITINGLDNWILDYPEFQRNRYYMVDSVGRSLTFGYFIFEKKGA